MDATDAYQKVLHDANPEVDSLLGLYEIGTVRRLDFGRAWGVAIGPKGLAFVDLKDAYRAWIGLLYTVVEMENALRNDYGIRHEPVTYDEAAGGPRVSPYKLQLLLQTHRRFMGEYLAKLQREPIEQLWAITSALHAEHHDVRWIRETIAAIEQSAAARAVARLDQEIAARLKASARLDRPPDPQTLEWCAECCTLLEQEDQRYMRELKRALCAGVRVFEQLERETIARGGGRLLAAARMVPKAIEEYYARVAAAGVI
jgi:sulfite reductase (NADPH) flavoprotein alpha-component